MAEGGFDERSPLLTHTNEDDDDVAAPTVAAPTDAAPTDGNVSMGFTPGEPRANSTPATRHTRMNTPGERPSFDELLPDIPGLSTTITAKNELYREFKFADTNKVKYFMDNDRLKVGLNAPKKPNYFLTTKEQGTEEYQINPRLPREVLKALGKSRRETIAEKMKQLTDEITDYKNRAADPNENQVETNKASQYASRKINERTDLKKELDQLKKGHYQPSENIAMETFKKHDEDRQQRQEEIQSEREKNNAILNAENSTPEEKGRAREANRELDQEANVIENERDRKSVV